MSKKGALPAYAAREMDGGQIWGCENLVWRRNGGVARTRARLFLRDDEFWKGEEKKKPRRSNSTSKL
jgi:hypothetical protein